MNSLLITYFLPTYLLTPWNGVYPEKLTGPQLGKKFPVSCETRRFITAFTSTLHLSLSREKFDPVRAPTSNLLKIYLNTRWFKYDRDYLCVNKPVIVPVIFEPPCIILPSMSGSSEWSLSLRFPHQNPVYTFSVSPIHDTCPPISFFSM